MKLALVAGFGLLLAGCARSDKQAAVQPESQPAPEYFRVDPAQAATVTGVVRFTGKKPQARRISMNAEEACETMNPKGIIEPTLVTGKNGSVANALVWVKSGLEGKQFQPPAEAVLLDQRACMFVPRVVALRTGQTIAVKNSDPVSHNVHPMPRQNREWNQHQAPDAPDLRRRFSVPEMLIPVKCNVHSWMRSYISVLEHPYFAVTGEDGRFTLANLPPGQYTVAVWHEVLGEQEQPLAAAAKAEVTVAFAFK